MLGLMIGHGAKSAGESKLQFLRMNRQKTSRRADWEDMGQVTKGLGHKEYSRLTVQLPVWPFSGGARRKALGKGMDTEGRRTGHEPLTIQQVRAS